jgi:hypothetical protein
MLRKIRRSTCGARLRSRVGCASDLFVNQSASFSYDCPSPPPTAQALVFLADQTITAVRNITTRGPARPAAIEQGDATQVRFRDGTFDAVVTDPPYDDMIDYSDSSDLFYVWARRAMATAAPDMAITSHPDGLQGKEREAIVKRGGTTGAAEDHRTRGHYDQLIKQAFTEANRVVNSDGVVTIVFGHGDPDVWQRLLSAIDGAGLVPQVLACQHRIRWAGWVGEHPDDSDDACRPAPTNRPSDAKAPSADQVDHQEPPPDWERWGPAPADMPMAAAGPAGSRRAAARSGRPRRDGGHYTFLLSPWWSRRPWRPTSTTTSGTFDPDLRPWWLLVVRHGTSRRRASCVGRHSHHRLTVRSS